MKIPNSSYTTVDTEFKGYFYDPALLLEGFSNYAMCHETYALTRVIYYMMTGKTNMDNIRNEALKKFVLKGLNSDKNERYTNVQEMKRYFEEMLNQ